VAVSPVVSIFIDLLRRCRVQAHLLAASRKRHSFPEVRLRCCVGILDLLRVIFN
jgi:hypothetical protein